MPEDGLAPVEAVLGDDGFRSARDGEEVEAHEGPEAPEISSLRVWPFDSRDLWDATTDDARDKHRRFVQLIRASPAGVHLDEDMVEQSNVQGSPTVFLRMEASIRKTRKEHFDYLLNSKSVKDWDETEARATSAKVLFGKFVDDAHKEKPRSHGQGTEEADRAAGTRGNATSSIAPISTPARSVLEDTESGLLIYDSDHSETPSDYEGPIDVTLNYFWDGLDQGRSRRWIFVGHRGELFISVLEDVVRATWNPEPVNGTYEIYREHQNRSVGPRLPRHETVGPGENLWLNIIPPRGHEKEWQGADPNEKLPCDQGEPEEEEPIFLVPPVEYLEKIGRPCLEVREDRRKGARSGQEHFCTCIADASCPGSFMQNSKCPSIHFSRLLDVGIGVHRHGGAQRFFSGHTSGTPWSGTWLVYVAKTIPNQPCSLSWPEVLSGNHLLAPLLCRTMVMAHMSPIPRESAPGSLRASAEMSVAQASSTRNSDIGADQFPRSGSVWPRCRGLMAFSVMPPSFPATGHIAFPLCIRGTRRGMPESAP